MKVNFANKVELSSAKLPRTRFNMSADCSTTAEWGCTQPIACKMVVPDSKSVLSVNSIIRAAPMLSPTFGRIKSKIWHSFVSMGDLFPQFASFLAQVPEGLDSNTIWTYNKMPFIRADILSSFVLAGAHVTLYRQDHQFLNNEADTKFTTAYPITLTDSLKDFVKNAFANMSGLHQDEIFQPETYLAPYHYTGPTLDLRCIWRNSSQGEPLYNKPIKIPIGNDSWESFADMSNFPDDRETLPETQKAGFDHTPVPLETADLVVTDLGADGYNYYALAFRLSSYGKRLRKILIGCGYQINLMDYHDVSLMPLLAYYKAYFDTFGLCLYHNWETTFAYRILRYFYTHNAPDWTDRWFDGSTAIREFMVDLGNCWVTEDQDFISAHIASTAVSPAPLGVTTKVYDVDRAANIELVDSSDSHYVNGHSYINDVFHGHLDSETLKRLYLWTNRNTIAGRRIAELLRAQGYGDWMDSNKSRFIGYSETIIDVSDVVATSDSFNETTNEGSILGEYAGLARAKDVSKNFEYENNEFGFIISMSAIVPDAGYSQAIDPTVRAIEKFDFFSREFDALGMQQDDKTIVHGAADVALNRNDRLYMPFGLVPRHSEYKVNFNRLNGDFSLRGVRDRFLPFNLDKVLPINTMVKLDENITDGHQGNPPMINKNFALIFDQGRLPTCGDVWRYTSRYAFLNLFNRVFNNAGNRELLLREYWRNYDSGNTLYEFVANDYDNWICHFILNWQYFAPMLPIEQSFGTGSGEDGKSFNSSMNKA